MSGLNGCWSHNNEREYLNHLINGTLWDHMVPDRPTLPTKKILENYIASAKKRMEWKTYVPRGHELIELAERALEKL